jgi:hypothetical protein
MSKIERFLSDPRYQALDDAGKKDKLDLFFNKYVTQDARYAPLDEEGKARVYSKFMSKYYGEPEAKAPKQKTPFTDLGSEVENITSLTTSAEADKLHTDSVESYMAKTHRGSADIGYSRGAASVADEPKPKNIFEAMDIGFTQGLTSVLSAPQMIVDIIQGDIYSANYTQGMIDQRLKDAGYDDMDMASAIKNKDLKKAGGMALKVFSQSAPVTALWLVHPLIGDVFGALMPTAASKYTQLDREMPELSTGKKIASAALAGTWEALSEEIGNRLAFMNKFVKIGRPNLAKLIAKEVGKTKVINAFAGGAMGAVGEGFEEYLSFNGEYWTDVMLGITDHDPKVYREGAINSTLLGIGAGGVQGGITTTVSSLLNARYSDIQGKLDKAASIDLSRYNGTDRWNAAKNTKMLAQKTQAAVQLAREGDTEGAIQLAKENLSAAQRILDKEQSSAIKTIGMYNSLLIDTATQYQEREEGLPVPSGVGAGEQATAIQEPTQQATESEPQSVEDTIVTLVQEGDIEAAENALNEAIKNGTTGINIPYLRTLVNESKAVAARIAKEEADQKARQDIIDKYGKYAEMSHSELQDEAKKRGLKAGGKSTDIMARLKESDEKPKAETMPAKPVVRESLTANKTIETQQDRAIKESLIAEETPKKASKYESMGYNALQKEAKKRGINSFGVKKAELIRQLEEKEASIEKTKNAEQRVSPTLSEDVKWKIYKARKEFERYADLNFFHRISKEEFDNALRKLNALESEYGLPNTRAGGTRGGYAYEQKDATPIEYTGKSDGKIDRNLVDAIKSGEAWVDYSPTSEEWSIAISEMKEEGTFWGIKDQDIIDQGIKIMEEIDELLDEIDNIDNTTKEYLDDLDESGTYISDEEIKEIVDENTKRIKEIEAKIKVLQKKHKDLWDNAKSDQSSQATTPVKAAEDGKAGTQDIDKLYNRIKTTVAGKNSQDVYILKRDLGLLLMPKVRIQEAESVADYYIALREGSVTQAEYDNYIDELIAENRVNDASDAEKSAARKRVDAYRNKKAEDSKPKPQTPKDDGYIRISIGDLIEHYKAMGMDRQRAWKEYIQDTVLSKRVITDSIDAKDFMPYFDRIQFPQKSDKMMPAPVKAAEDIESEVMSRSTFQEQYRQAQDGKLPKGQIDAQLKLYDAMMDTYAKEMGITIDEAYAEVIDSVTADEPVEGTARRSGARYQTIQGYIQKMPNGKYRIGIMQPNVTTGLHEQAHLGKSLMEIMANKSPAWASRLKAAEEWCGVKDGKWTTEAEEKFANGYVKFLADGSAPNGKLKTIFAKIKEWIGSILQGLADVKNLDVSNEMRGVYLSMLGISEGKRNLTSEQKVQSIKLKSAMKQDATSDPLKLETEIDSFADSNDLILEGKRTGNKTSFYLNRIDDGKTMIEIHHSNGEYEVNGYHAANNQEVMEQVTRILGDTRYQTTDMPSAAEIAEAERQMAEVRAKYEGTGWYKSLPTWEIITRMNNVTDTPYNQKIKEGELFRDSAGDDPYIYETRYVNPKDYIDKVHLEGETYDKVVSMPTTQKYIEWYKQGYEPPPMTLIIHYKNGLTPTERRRWVAAIEAGVDKVPALVEIGRASEMLNSPLYLKAPNGKPTNLNERQWLQVRTENFKDWFGDWENDPKNASKVVDENGEPRVVYHGSGNSFNEFMFSGYHRDIDGYYFSSDKDSAMSYTDLTSEFLYEVFLNVRNPIVKDYNGSSWNSAVAFNPSAYNVIPPHDDVDVLEEDLGYLKTIDGLVQLALSNNHDGVIANNIEDQGENLNYYAYVANTYVAFAPTQIKSATANVGTFSESNDIRYQIDNAIQSASPDMQDRIAKIMEKQKKVQQAANATYRELTTKIGRTTSVYEWDSMMRKSLVTAIRNAFPGAAPMNIEKYAALEETLGELDPGLEDHAKEIKRIKAQLRRMVAMDKKFRDALEDVSGFSDIADIPFEGLFSALENTNPAAYDRYFKDETFDILLKALPKIKTAYDGQFTMQTLQRIVDVILNGNDPNVGRDVSELAFLQPQRLFAELFGKAGINTINYAYHGTLKLAAYEMEYTPHLRELNRLLMTSDNNRGSAYDGDDLDIIGRTIFEVDGNSEISNKLETIQERLAEWAEENNAVINSKDVEEIYNEKEYLKDIMRGFIAEWNANPERTQKIGIREDYDNPRKYNWGDISDITTKGGKYLYTPGNARERSKQDFSEGLDYDTNIFNAYSNYMYSMTRYMAFYDLANYVEGSSILYASKGGKAGQKKMASGFDLDLSLAQHKSSAYASKMIEDYVRNTIGYHKKDTPKGRLLASARTNVYASLLAANVIMTVLNYNQRNLIHSVVDQNIAMQVRTDVAFWTGLFKPSNEEYPTLSGIMQAYVTANQSLVAELAAEAKRSANQGRTALTRAYYKHSAYNAELLRLSPFSLAELGNRAYAHAAGVYQVTQNSMAYKEYVASGMSRHQAMERALSEDSNLRRAAITYGGIINAEINADANRAFSPHFFGDASKIKKVAVFLRYGVTIALLELRTYGGARDIKSLLSPDLFRLLTSGNVKAATAAQTIQAGAIMKSMLHPKRIAELVRKGQVSTAKTSKNLITVNEVNMVRDAITWALDVQAKHTEGEFHNIIRGKSGAKQAMAALMAFSVSEVLLRSLLELLFSLIPWWKGKKKFIETDVIENIASVLGLFQGLKTASNVRLGSTLAPDLGAYNPTAKTTTKALSQYVLRLTPYAGFANYMGKVFTGKYFSDLFWDEVYD